MIVDFRNEIWRLYKGVNWVKEDEYLFSNYGRVKRGKVYEDEWELSKIS